jgi:flagellar motility protein MotE (MotC chaperone)
MGSGKMEPKLKSSWSWTVLGFLCTVLVAVVFHNIRAYGSKDSRIKEIENPQVAGIKNDTPMSREMVEALKRKEQEVAERERKLKDEAERLQAEEARIKSRIDELIAIQNKIDKDKAEQLKLAEETKAKLVKTFEKMQPKKSAAVIAGMEDPMAVELLKSLKEKSVAAILENMPSDRAMVLSTLIAGQKPAALPVAGQGAQKSPAGQASP